MGLRGIANEPKLFKTLNVGARQRNVASSRGSDTNRVDFVGNHAVRAFTRVHYHRGYSLLYSANPKTFQRALLAALNEYFSVLFWRHCWG